VADIIYGYLSLFMQISAMAASLNNVQVTPTYFD